MVKLKVLASQLVLLVLCSILTTTNAQVKTISEVSQKYAETITEGELSDLLYIYASDAFKGRETGTIGEQKAIAFLENFYKSINVLPGNGSSYKQKVPLSFSDSSYNVLALIKGYELPKEYIVISAHLDHLGETKRGKINNGADDDGSGTVALLEIAEAFKLASDEGYKPKRSIIFLHVTGEEKGLLGSAFYTENPIYPLENTVANLNIDMIGRIDPQREGKENYIYLIGSNKLSTELHLLSEEVNKKCCNIELDYTYNKEDDPNRFYYRSDHYNFARHNIPIIFYFNGVHEDYHKPSDTPDKIEYDLLRNRAHLVFNMAWELANRGKRVLVDRDSR